MLMLLRSVKYLLLISVLGHQRSKHVHTLKNSLIYAYTTFPRFKIHENIDDKIGVL